MIRTILLRDLKAVFRIYGDVNTIWFDRKKEKIFVRYKLNKEIKRLCEDEH